MDVKIKEKDWETSGSGKTFIGELPIIVFGCEHKNVYQGYWLRGMCMDCGQYIEDKR